MKRCPDCQSIYTDDTLSYCLQDGVPLVDVREEVDDGPETVLRIPVAPPELSKPTAAANFGGDVSAGPAKRSKTIPIVLITLLALILAAGGTAYVAYLYFGKRDVTEVSSHSKSTKKTPVPISKEDAARASVEKRVRNWVEAAKAGKIETYMEFYGDKIRYYNKKNASRSFVRSDKKKAFDKYSRIEIKISNLAIKISDSNDRAAVEFDKEWVFSKGAEKNSGKVRSHLEFRRIDGEWKIEAERDAKIYYVNK
jgi:ketosteroid isomerase-like protein